MRAGDRYADAETLVVPLFQQRVGDLDRLGARQRRQVRHRGRVTLLAPRHGRPARDARPQSILIARFFDFSAFGSVTSSMPSFSCALAPASSTAAGKVTVREKLPCDTSQR